MTPEPPGKLVAAFAVNGPEDAILDWHAIDWRVCEESVRRLRQRIFTATQAGARLATVRRLCPPASLQGLLEPDARKRASPVLRGAGRSNAPGLPGLRHEVARNE